MSANCRLPCDCFIAHTITRHQTDTKIKKIYSVSMITTQKIPYKWPISYMALCVFSRLSTVHHIFCAKIFLYFFSFFTLLCSVFSQFLIIIFPLNLSAKMKDCKVYTELEKLEPVRLIQMPKHASRTMDLKPWEETLYIIISRNNLYFVLLLSLDKSNLGEA